MNSRVLLLISSIKAEKLASPKSQKVSLKK
jgi:hypothetical protein